MNEEYLKSIIEIVAGIETSNGTQSIAKYELIEYVEQLKDRIDKTNQKLELLLNDLKINSKEEKETGKSYFNTNLFAIRIKEISKTLNGESNEQ